VNRQWALDLERAAEAFREAADGDSNDAEHDAAVELANLAEGAVDAERTLAAAIATLRAAVGQALDGGRDGALVDAAQQVIAAFDPTDGDVDWVNLRGATLMSVVDEPDHYIVDVFGVDITVRQDDDGVLVRVESSGIDHEGLVSVAVGDDEPVRWNDVGRVIAWRGAELRWIEQPPPNGVDASPSWVLHAAGVEAQVCLQSTVLELAEDGDVVGEVPLVEVVSSAERADKRLMVAVQGNPAIDYGFR
jgi:hypothetical protein